MFIGKKKYVDAVSYDMIDAGISLDATLADVDLMQWSQEAQTEIDANVQKLMQEVGLTNDEVIKMATLSEAVAYPTGNPNAPYSYEGKVAWQPGTVNSLVFGDYMVLPDPFGPAIGGADPFKKDIQDRLGTSANQLGHDGHGLKVYFTDDW